MKARLPYIFYVDRRTGNGDIKRSPQVRNYECQVAEVHVNETERVASWGWMVYRHTRDLNRAGACIRWNDELYVPVTSESYDRDLIPAVVSGEEQLNGRHRVETFTAMYRGIASADQRIYHLHSYLEGKNSIFSNAKADRIVNSTEETDLATIAEMAEGLLVTDNRVWQRAVGLHLRVKEVGAQGNLDNTELQFDYSKDGGRTWADDYWWNDHRQVCIHRASLNDLEHIGALTTQVQRPAFYDLEVHDEDSLAFAGKREYLGRAVKELISTSSVEVGGFEQAKIMRWLAVRDDILNLLVNEDADAVAPLTALAALSNSEKLRSSVAQALKSFAVYDNINALKARDRPSPLPYRS